MKKVLQATFPIIVFLICFFAIVSLTYGAPTAVQIGNGGTGTATVPNYGQLLVGNGAGGYSLLATSSLGIIANAPVTSIFGRTGAITAQFGDYTTSLIPEGSNLYWTPARFDARLSATSSLPNITTLSGLSLPYSQLTGTPNLSQYFPLAAWFATTSAPQLTTLANLALPVSQLTGTLGVAHGGTASTTLFGILKGNGTGSVQSAIGNTDYQLPIALTTTGSSGAATFNGNTLNIPQYTGTPFAWTPTTFGNATSTTLGFLNGLLSAASSTFTGNFYSNGLTTLATTTSYYINGNIVVDGSHFAQTSLGIQLANDICYSVSCKEILLRNGTYDITAPINLSTSTNLVGETQNGVVLLQNPANIASMSFAILQGKGFYAQHVTIKNMTIDGNYDNLGSHPSNVGQLVAPSDYWDVEYVTLQNANSFYTFPNGTNYVTYRHITFQSTGIGGTGSDILGGGGNSHMDVEYNTWLPGLHGNMFDNVNGDSNNLSHNHFLASNRGIYLEGMTRTTFFDNDAPFLAIESNAGYSPSITQNATGTVATDNRFMSSGYSACASIQYISSSTAPYTAGGDNEIENNTCTGSVSGFLKTANADAADGGGDIISNNTIYDINPNNIDSYNTGLGVVIAPSGINILQGHGMTVNNNTVVDDRPLHFARYAVSFGAGGTSVYPNFITAVGNIGTGMASGTTNIVSPSNSNAITILDGAGLLSAVTANVSGALTDTGSFNLSTTSVSSTVNPMRIALAGSRSNSNHGVYITESSSAGPNATMDITDSNTQSNWATLFISSVRTGRAMEIDQSGTGQGLYINHTGSSGAGLNVSVTGTGAALLTSGGNVGIGTSTPGSLLSINGIANFTTGTSTLYGAGGINLTSGCYSINNVCLPSLSVPVSIANGGTGTTTGGVTNGVEYYNGSYVTNGTLTWNGSVLQLGNNGLGSSLYFSNSSFRSIREATNSQGGQNINFYNSVGSNTGGSFNFQASDRSNVWLTILDSSGNVGVSSSTPFARLSLHANNGDTNRTLFAIGSSTASATTTLFSVDNTGTTYIAGNIGIGTTSPANTLSVQGSGLISGNLGVAGLTATGTITVSGLASCGGIQTNAAGVMSCTSDARLKEIHGAFTAGLSAIMGIHPQSYSWKAGTPLYDGGSIYYGFIAQDVQQALPDAVETNKQGYLQVSQLAIQAALVNAVKDQQAEIETLKAPAVRASQSAEENWQDASIALLFVYAGYNEFTKRRTRT